MGQTTTSSIIDTLYGCFDAIYRQWQAAAPKETHLWDLSADKTAAQLLEQDLIDIGAYFAGADAIGERSETFLIAECIAHLRALSSEVTRPSKEKVAEEIGNWLLTHPERSTLLKSEIYAPLSYRIAQLSVARGIAHRDTLDVLRQAIIDLAYHFLLRDGNITTEEDKRIKEFHAALS